jgi:hypothetical protein
MDRWRQLVISAIVAAHAVLALGAGLAPVAAPPTVGVREEIHTHAPTALAPGVAAAARARAAALVVVGPHIEAPPVVVGRHAALRVAVLRPRQNEPAGEVGCPPPAAPVLPPRVTPPVLQQEPPWSPG